MSLREKYNIPNNKKVILYAPTWRESSDGGKSRVIKPPINIEYWERELSSEYILLFRMHHLTNKVLNIEFNNFVRDYSGAYNVNDLMIISDILITDYSSILTDYSILERPVFLFAYDYDSFIKGRGLYTRLEDLLPGNVCLTEHELIEHIHKMNYENEACKVKSVKHKYVYEKNDSTQKCIEALKNHISLTKS